jgi:8-oxo-dGTP pyrophosphatase MutT (NUDIX family)
MTERYLSIVDVHMILRRKGKILLLRRAGNVYSTGMLCLPSGHLEDGESVLSAAVRETKEETGIALEPAPPGAPRASGPCAPRLRRWSARADVVGEGNWQVSAEMYLRCTCGGVTGRRRDPPGSAVPSQHVLTLMGSVQRPGGNRNSSRTGRAESVLIPRGTAGR